MNKTHQDAMLYRGLERSNKHLKQFTYILNHSPAEFLKWNNPPSIFRPVHFHFRDIKMKTLSWSAKSIEPGQTAQMCRLAWLYTGGKG